MADIDYADEGHATAERLATIQWRGTMPAADLAAELAALREQYDELRTELREWVPRYFVRSKKVWENGRERVELTFWLDDRHIAQSRCVQDELEACIHYAEQVQRAHAGMCYGGERRAG